MRDQREGIHRVAVHQHVELDHLGRLVTVVLVIQRAVTPGDALDPVVEVDQYFVERNAPDQDDPAGVQRLGFLDDAALFAGQVHHVADVLVRAHEVRLHHRLGDGGNEVWFRQVDRVVDVRLLAPDGEHLVNHARIGGDDVHVELAPQPLLDDLKVQ